MDTQDESQLISRILGFRLEFERVTKAYCRQSKLIMRHWQAEAYFEKVDFGRAYYCRLRLIISYTAEIAERWCLSSATHLTVRRGMSVIVLPTLTLGMCRWDYQNFQKASFLFHVFDFASQAGKSRLESPEPS